MSDTTGAAADLGVVLESLRTETSMLVDRALTVFLEYDFLDYSVLGGTLTGGHVITYLAREADRMADTLVAAMGRSVPARDRGRQWEIGEGGHLRPGAVLIDDFHVATERLEAAIADVPDWSECSDGLRAIPSRRLLQVVVHHVDLGRPWDALPEEHASVAVALLPSVLAPEIDGFRLGVDDSTSALRSERAGSTLIVEGSARLLLAWASGRTADVTGIPEELPRPPLREWI